MIKIRPNLRSYSRVGLREGRLGWRHLRLPPGFAPGTTTPRNGQTQTEALAIRRSGGEMRKPPSNPTCPDSATSHPTRRARLHRLCIRPLAGRCLRAHARELQTRQDFFFRLVHRQQVPALKLRASCRVRSAKYLEELGNQIRDQRGPISRSVDRMSSMGSTSAYRRPARQ